MPATVTARRGQARLKNAAPATVPRPVLARRVRAYRALGMLVDTTTRHARREVCAACPHHIATEHRGLWRCAAPAQGCGCIGGDEIRLALRKTHCERWDDAAQT